jgi:hypothetical protein
MRARWSEASAPTHLACADHLLAASCCPALPTACAACSLEELQFALQELGVQEAQEQSRAAAELLQLAASVSSSSGEGGSEGAAEDDGTIGFDAFMAFQRRVRGWCVGVCGVLCVVCGLRPLARPARAAMHFWGMGHSEECTQLVPGVSAAAVHPSR